MGFDGLRRVEPQELRPKAAHRANMSRSGVVGSQKNDVEIDEGSSISFLKLRLTQKTTTGIKKLRVQTKYMRIFQRVMLNCGGLCEAT